MMAKERDNPAAMEGKWIQTSLMKSAAVPNWFVLYSIFIAFLQGLIFV